MPSSPRNLILLLPFTSALLESPTPLLSDIYSSLRRHTSLHSFLVYFSTPPLAHASTTDIAQAAGEQPDQERQLYDQIRARPRATWTAFQRFLSVIYSTLAAAQWEGVNEGNGRIHVRVDVGFEGKEGRWEGRFMVCDEVVILQSYENLPHPPLAASTPINPVPCPQLPSCHDTSISMNDTKTAAYPVVALGGTFDHLHAAHKLLLHSAYFLATRKLIVGVISPSLLAGKAHAQYVEGLEDRMRGVREFLECLGGDYLPSDKAGEGCGEQSDAGRGVILDIVEIHDAFGPTATEEDIQALVISDETRSGGDAVNALRRGKGWDELDVWCIEVISGKRADDQQDTNIERMTSPLTREQLDGETTADSATLSSASVASEVHMDGVDASGVHGKKGEQEAIRTKSLKGLDEKTLKEVKMGSTGIRAWLAAKAQERKEARG